MLLPLIIIGAILIAITFLFAGLLLTPKKISTLADLVKQGKTTAATRAAKNILSKEPRNIEAHFLLGKAYLLEEKPELALMEFKTINQIGNFYGVCSEIPFRKAIADLFLRFDQHEEALKEYLILIKREPYEANNYYMAGTLFVERNHSERATDYFRKAIEIDPKHSEAHFQLGYLLYRSKKPIEAKREFESAIRTNPENYPAHFYQGRIMKDNHDYVAALLSFEKAQRTPEFKVKALVERGSCYMHMNNFDKAITELERAIKLSSQNNSTESMYARYFLALCYEKMRNLDKAVEHWEIIYAKAPTFRDVAEKLSQYQELRTDDRIKDFLTCNQDVFMEMCRNVMEVMNMKVRDIQEAPNGCQAVAIERDDEKWRNTRKLPVIIRLLRVPEMVEESTVRNMHEEMKKDGITKALMITSSTFSRMATEFAEQRPIDLMGKEELQELLCKIDLDSVYKNA